MGKYKSSDAEFIEAVKRSYSYAGVCRALGLCTKGGNYQTIKNRISKLNLDTSHFTGQLWSKGKKLGSNYFGTAIPLENVLKENTPYSSDQLRQRLINEGLKECKCEICGKSEWEGVPIRLHLHHINENHNDNRLENLQILCPNCHANLHSSKPRKTKQEKEKIFDDEIYIPMTEEDIKINKEAQKLRNIKKISIEEARKLIQESPNNLASDFVVKERLNDIKCPICGKYFHPKNKIQKYCSEECVHKSQQKSERPSREEFLKVVKQHNVNFTKIGEHFGVTDNAIKKWCKSYELPIHKKDLTEYINNNSEERIIDNSRNDRKYNKELICALYLEGYNQKEVARFIECCEDTISTTLSLNNIKKRSGGCKKVGQYSLNGDFIQYFYSTEEAGEWCVKNGLAESSHSKKHISECCTLKIKSAYGYIWKYEQKIPMEEIAKQYTNN